jgi:hypothetical protein
MISVILYGRNDAHGYNLHKRAAISFNCIAEALSDPDDEILFVDYNTPNDLPTFVEAIYDTLTPRAKSVLRVFRVRPQLHARLVARTHLFALEPHSRNIALRRSNPRNRWVLLTNTDMIFTPREGVRDLTDAARGLPDAQYILPRFELPEPLWESFPRMDPQAVMRSCDELGRKLHLEEIAVAFSYMRFDSPGDFQLIPRQALFDINGFDERMIHGWHADSNMCKRLYLFFGDRSDSLAHRLKGYHCDHTRVATLAHRLDIKLENDLQEFVFSVKDPVARHQAESWGIPGETVEEVDFASGAAARFPVAVERALGEPQCGDYHSDCNDLRNYVWYQPEHALPYLAGNLTVYPKQARFLYAGNNPRMLQLAARAIAELGFERPLHYIADLFTTPPEACGAVAVGKETERALADFDLIVFDFGLDRTRLGLERVERVTDWPKGQRHSLGAVAMFLEECTEASDALARRRGHIPDFLVVNANHHIFRAFAAQFLIAADTPYPTHVRKGRPRVREERLYKGSGWKYTEDLMRSFFGYNEPDQTPGAIAAGSVVDLTSAADCSRYKDGHWGAMDYTGSWIDGRRAAIVFSPPAQAPDDLIAFVRINEAFIGPENEPMYVQVFFEGEFLIRWTVYTRYEVTVCKAVLPARLLAGRSVCRLEFVVENPQSADRVARARGQQVIGEDPRELGVKIQKIEFSGPERIRYSLGDALDFTETGAGQEHTNECWTQPDGFGMWTLGASANLVLLLRGTTEEAVNANFTVSDVAVSAEEPNVDVYVSVNGRELARWTLGPTRQNDERRVLLPAGALSTPDPVNIQFRIPDPRTPSRLGWSASDFRPLGFRITTLRLSPAGSNRYKTGEVIDFAEGGDCLAFIEDFMGVQWSLPDAFGAWTVGKEAKVKVELEAPTAGALPGALVISDCVVSDAAPKMPVTLRVNGHKVAEWVLGPYREVHARSFLIPAEATAGRTDLLFTFEIPEPRSPQSLGWTTDARPLGFRLARLTLGSETIAMPTFQKVAARRSMIRRVLGLPQFSLHVARILYRRYRDR